MRSRKAIKKPVSDSCVHREGTKGEIMEDDCWKMTSVTQVQMGHGRKPPQGRDI